MAINGVGAGGAPVKADHPVARFAGRTAIRTASIAAGAAVGMTLGAVGGAYLVFKHEQLSQFQNGDAWTVCVNCFWGAVAGDAIGAVAGGVVGHFAGKKVANLLLPKN